MENFFSQYIGSLIALLSFIVSLSPNISKLKKIFLVLVCCAATAYQGYCFYKQNQESYENLFSKADILTLSGDYKAALQYINKALEKKPHSIQALLLCYKITSHQGDIDKSLSLLQKIVSVDNKNSFAYRTIGDIYYYKKHNQQQALIFYKKAVSVDGNDFHSISMIKKIEIDSEIERKQQGVVDSWIGYYITNQGKMSSRLKIISVRNKKVKAIFEFWPHPDNPGTARGSYEMIGEISPEYTLTLVGTRWIKHPPRYQFFNFSATVDLDNNIIFQYEDKNIVHYSRESIFILENISNKNNKVYLSTIRGKIVNGSGTMKNNNPLTIRGKGYHEKFVSSTAYMEHQDIVSLCSIRPFSITYFFNKKYNLISGTIGYDDSITLQKHFLGLSSEFKGTTNIYFSSEGKTLLKIQLTPQILMKEFSLNIKGVQALQIYFDFGYSNMFYDNFMKYFNLIDVELK